MVLAGFDDKQSLRGAGPLHSAASDPNMSMRSIDTADAFSDQEDDSETARINREALRYEIAGGASRGSARSAMLEG